MRFPVLVRASLLAAGFLVQLSCEGETPITECRNELYVSRARLVCPDFRVEYHFNEFRVSLYDRNGISVIRNMSAMYSLERPNPESISKEDITLAETYDVSDTFLLDGEERVPEGRRHGTSILPLGLGKETPFGKDAALEIAAGGTYGGFVQKFVGYSTRDFILLYTDFANPSKKAVKYFSLSPVVIDGLQHPWSRTSSGLVLSADPEGVTIQSPSPDAPYQIFTSPEGDSVLFVGLMTSDGNRLTVQPPSPDFTRWSISELYSEGRELNPSPPSYEMDVLYFDVNRKPAAEAVNQFTDLRSKFSRVPTGFPFGE